MTKNNWWQLLLLLVIVLLKVQTSWTNLNSDFMLTRRERKFMSHITRFNRVERKTCTNQQKSRSEQGTGSYQTK